MRKNGVYIHFTLGDNGRKGNRLQLVVFLLFLLDSEKIDEMLNGKYKKVICNVDDFFNVLEISGKWVKVKVISKDRTYIK